MKRNLKRITKTLLWVLLFGIFDLFTRNYWPSWGNPPIPWKENLTHKSFWVGICMAFIVGYIYLLVTEDADEEKEVDETHQNKDKQG